MLEVAVAVSMASSAFSSIKKAVNMGRDIEDVAGYFGRFFDAKESIAEAGQQNLHTPKVKKLLSGSSVEAQALELTAAKHKIQRLDTELREFLIYSGQSQFYRDMMKERTRIAQERFRIAKKQAEDKRFWIDMSCIIAGVLASVGIIFWVISFFIS